ncbi:MAG: type II toxin-antitoxin system PemK/MazF family toxin [Candidatus Latescibacterota bacterium]|jgi:mRNA interferase MazF
MPNYSMNDVVLVQYPFSDLSASKIRPAIIVSTPHTSQDVFIVPLTSQTTNLLAGEFVLESWQQSGLNVSSAIKRGLYTIHQNLILKKVGQLTQVDQTQLTASLKSWLNIT